MSSGKAVVVIGDVMLDVYISGEAWRISPEAPVPVVAVNSRSHTLGGAGNVALNLVGLGCKTWLFGALGSDVSGDKVMSILNDNGIEFEFEFDEMLPTTTKTRVMANNQQLLRFDEEGMFNGDGGRYDKLIEKVLATFSKSWIGAVVLSDYNKGVLSVKLSRKVIDFCRGLELPVLVDPKRGDWKIYRRANIVKPNLFELKEATGFKNLDDHNAVSVAARMMLRDYELDAVLVTMGSRGMMLVTAERNEFIPTMAKEVFDVSGAGDTVVATLAACICSGHTLSDAARIANEAAGIVVGKLGTCPIASNELDGAGYTP
jgi:D-beta-D-heptose 7-phosphate kinase/D-beta-D-heptose 1-phosphate adenosyltransferase